MQVTRLKQEVMRIKADTNRKAKLSKTDSRGVLEQVSNLQNDLDNSKGGNEQLKMRARHAEMQRDAAQRRESQTQAEISAMRTKLDVADEEIDKLRCEVRKVSTWA
jgi:chromosome segregation ATPase